ARGHSNLLLGERRIPRGKPTSEYPISGEQGRTSNERFAPTGGPGRNSPRLLHLVRGARYTVSRSGQRSRFLHPDPRPDGSTLKQRAIHHTPRPIPSDESREESPSFSITPPVRTH